MSEIITDKLTGKTAAGNVTITSEGGAVTMQLQQGLAKSFINHFEGTTVNGSFNVTSLVDNGTGDHEHSFVNNHNDIYYAACGSIIGDSSTQTNTQTHSCVTAGNAPATCHHNTSLVGYKTVHMSNVANDHQMVQIITHGDLA